MHLFIIFFLTALIICEFLFYLKVKKISPDNVNDDNKNVLKNSLVSSLYPITLLYIVFIPYIVVFFIDSKSLDIHLILLLFMWIPIYSYLFYLTGKKILLFLVSIPLLLVGTLDILFWMTIGGPVTQENIMGILQSNQSEVDGFLSTNFSFYKVLIAGLYWVFGFYLLIKEKSKDINKWKAILNSALFILIVATIAYKSTYAELEDIYPRVHSAFFRYHKETAIINEYLKKRELSNEKINAEPFNTIKKQLYVLIIGESTSRNHMSIYGYNRDTNPLLKSRDDIFIFNDVVSAFSNTRRQLASSLTQANYKTVDSFYVYPSILDIARSAGFRTYWISNQEPLGFVENQVTLFSKLANETYFVKLESRFANTKNNIPYDEALIPLFKNVLENDENKKFIILHLMGTHMPYKNRYPSPFNVFNNGNSHKENIINEYNNSILYNDFIVDSLFKVIDHYSQGNTISGAIYFSDHGQEVYDLPSNYVGHGSNPTNRYQVEIPFIVWLSETFKEERQLDFQDISGTTNHSFMTDDLNHALLNLMGIETPLLDKEKSLFSKNYKPKKRILYGQDYDLEMKNSQ